MGKIRVRYLVTKRKNGKEYLYWQPNDQYRVAGEWKKCPLPPRPVKSIDEAKALYEKLKAWRSGGDAAKELAYGTWDWLIAEFKKSDIYKSMAPATQANYRGHFKDFHPVLGDIPLLETTVSMAYGLCNKFSENPRKPSAIAATGRALFKYARKLDNQFKVENPFAELGIKKPKPRRQVWSHEQEKTLLEGALEQGRQDIYDASIIGLYSTQRPQDIRAASVNAYDGKWWRITQKKTGAVVDIPVYRLPKLKAVLDRLVKSPDSPVMLICKENNKPFTKETLSKGFREVCNKAGIDKEMQFRDFRRTGVVRLGEAGCTDIEISAWSGHTIDSVSKILEVYLPRNRTMADNAAKKAQKRQKLELRTSNSLKLV